MSRIEQVNSLLIKELASIVNGEISVKESLITISYVRCSADLRDATIGFTVLPDKYAVLAQKALNSRSGIIAEKLRKKIRFKTMPRFHWKMDASESEAAEIDEILERINSEANH